MIFDSTLACHFFFVVLFARSCSSEETRSCQSFQKKLNQYSIQMKYQPDQLFTPLRLCPSLNNTCCPQSSADLIQNATVIELYQLFELYSMNIYEPLLRLTQNINKTMIYLIEQSRNETHQVLQRGYHQLYISYRSVIDRFFHHLLNLTSRTYHHELSHHVDQLFQDILRISLTFNQNQSFILPSYLSCLWKNQPFGQSPTQFTNQLDLSLGKLFQLNDLFKLSHELVQVLSTGVTTDYHCIDSYMQLSYCNLCHGRDELPCRENCRLVMESCLINITLIDQIWQQFIDSTENVDYFHGIAKVFSSIGLSISEAVMTFLNSGGVQNKDIINQCGRLRLRRQTFALETHVNTDDDDDDDDDDQRKRSFFDQQLSEWSQSLQRHRLFWKQFPEQICRAKGISAEKDRQCWTGTSLGEDQRASNGFQYDKPLSLKLQWILKEMKEKSQMIGSLRRTTSALASNPSTTIHTPVKSTDLDEYPSDNEFDYSDYAYEDPTDQTTTTTTTMSSTSASSTISTSTVDDSSDDSQTAFYDYGDHDVYSDDELEETSTVVRETITATTTAMLITTKPNWKDRIPYYHRRTPIIWNIQYREDNDEFIQGQSGNSASSSSSSSLIYSSSSMQILLGIIFIRV